MFKKLLGLIFLLSLLIVPFLTCALNEQSPFEFIKLFALSNISLLVFSAVIAISLKEKRPEFRWNNGLTLVGIILLANTVSFSFSNNQVNSFWADINVPTDSMLTIIVFFLFSFSSVQLFTDKDDLKKIKYTLITMATALAGYGIIQHFGLDPVDWWGYRQMAINAYGTIGQAVGFGMIVGSIIALVVMNFLQEKKLMLQVLKLISLLVLSLGILYSGSRTPALAAVSISVAGVLVFLLKYRTRSALIKAAAVILTLLLAQSIYFFEGQSTALQEKFTGESIGKGLGERAYIWEDAITIWKKYPILGAGPETFSTEQKIVNRKEHNQYANWELTWTKAHNHYIHHLATTGLVGFAAELLLLLFLFFDFYNLLRKKDFSAVDLDSVGYVLGYFYLCINYLTAFNFVITQLFSYLLPTIYFIYRCFEKPRIIQVKLPRFIYLATAAAAYMLTAQLVLAIYHYWRADVLFGETKREFILQKNAVKAIAAIDEAIAIQSYNPRLYCRKATIVTALITTNATLYNEAQTAETLKLINQLLNFCVNLDDTNAEDIAVSGKLLAELYLKRLIPDPSPSIEAFLQAAKVNPNNPTYYYRIGSLYLNSNRPEDYVANMKLALELKADYLPAYTDLIGFYYRRGDQAMVDKLVHSVAKLKIDNAEFISELGNMINLAELNKDLTSKQILINVYMSVKYLAEGR